MEHLSEPSSGLSSWDKVQVVYLTVLLSVCKAHLLSCRRGGVCMYVTDWSQLCGCGGSSPLQARSPCGGNPLETCTQHLPGRTLLQKLNIGLHPVTVANCRLLAGRNVGDDCSFGYFLVYCFYHGFKQLPVSTSRLWSPWTTTQPGA